MNGISGLHAVCEDEIDALVRQTAGIDSAAVVSGDGFEIAARLRGEVSGEKFAAMASSLLSLSEAVTQELRMRQCRNVIIQTDLGAVVTMRVPVGYRELLISALCNDASTLGAVLFATRECAQRLGQRLSQSTTP